MTGPPARPSSTRLLARWLRVVARMVPRHARGAWLEEWAAELEVGLGAGPAGPRRTLDLAAGILRDGLGLRISDLGLRLTSAGRGTARAAFGVGRDRLGRHLLASWRRLHRSPVLSLGVVGTLALGISANTAIFAVADVVLLKPLPYADADRLALVWETGPQRSTERTRVSVPDYLDWREQADVFEDLAAYADAGFNVAIGGRAIRVDGQVVSSSLFPLLGIRPAMGRGFLPVEDGEGQGLTVVLSHDFWQRELGGDAEAVGRSLTIDGASHTVAGVMPQDFRFPGGAAMWLPLGVYGGNLRVWRATHVLTVIARLRTDVDGDVAASALTELAQELWERAPIWTGWRISVRPFREEVHGDFTETAGFLWVAGLSLLLVMCANLANLFLASGISRRNELAVRRALGAGRRELLAQAGVEVGLMCAAATVMGLGLSVVVIHWLAGALPRAVTAVHPFGLDHRAVGYAVLLAAASGLVLGALPALRHAATSVAEGLRESARGGGAASAARLRAALVAGQVALSLGLVVTTLLTVDSYGRLRDVDPGFRTTNVVSFRLALAGPEYASAEARRAFHQAVERELAGVSGVRAVGLGSRVPFVASSGESGVSVWVVGQVRPPGEEQPLADLSRASPGLLPTLGVTVTRGRGLSASDDLDAPAVVVVNRAAAAMLWPGREPLGARIRTGGTGEQELTVVGIVEDMRLADLRVPPSPQLFVAAAQFPPATQTFVVQTDRSVQELATDLRAAVAVVDPTQPIHEISALEAYIDHHLAGPILTARVLSAMSALSVALAALGIYAVMAFTVGLRRREFSVRRAFGAEPGNILALVLREGGLVVGTGLAVGAIVAAGGARVIASQLYGVSPLDPSKYLVAGALLAALGLVSALGPALAAARVSPARAMRD